MLAATVTNSFGETNIYDVVNTAIRTAAGDAPASPASPAAPVPGTTSPNLTTPKPTTTATWPKPTPWYKSWKVWAAVAGGVAVVGGGMYALRSR